MQTPPRGLPDDAVLEAVRAGWDPGAGSLTHLPVGYGSHHWATTGADGRRWFVTADATPDDASAARLAAAYGVPAAARAHGVAGAHGPVAAADGALLHRVGPWSVSVQPWLDGTAGGFSDRWADADAEAVVRLLAALHAVDAARTPAPLEDPALPGRDGLEVALDRCGRGEPLAGGPLAGAVAEALHSHLDAVRQALGEDAAGTSGAADGVLTHGEPHPGNVVRTADGPVLVDWDTARRAEPERDLWLVAARTDIDVTALYADLAGRVPSPGRMRWRERRWALADVAAYVVELAAAPAPDADTAWQLRSLRATLAGLDG
ncbi:aminoglycoside phosphotransferase family protein [Arthrobacter sp. NEB 688]|uniref:phosphotransferase n=1 Tax=Arthrobacter sp. NEB 688 TaxID=904039 RepID=UPI0015678FD2|nr:aminoglycoside phosphotransferase family protein [Arthrobacter sp. NEB 688]QKE83289.1 aminoglycoside phosphotransferase family protein [Arthrobacter sp. NEB 688]